MKPYEVSKLFYEKHQIQVSHGLVKRLLKELGYGYRKQTKQLATGSYERRDEHSLFFSIGNEHRKPCIEYRLQEERTFG